MSMQVSPEAAVWQIGMPGADRSYAAAHDWIQQTVAPGKRLSPPDEEKLADGEDPVGAVVLTVLGEHRA
ncbi:MAG: hypothetical protein ACLP8X_19250 [Streptosporangiaceae bacterium]